MVFEQQPEVVRTPTRIRMMRIEMTQSADELDPKYPQSYTYDFVLVDQNNEVMRRYQGDLLPHLTTAQKTAIEAFFDAMWAKAETEVIP